MVLSLLKGSAEHSALDVCCFSYLTSIKILFPFSSVVMFYKAFGVKQLNYVQLKKWQMGRHTSYGHMITYSSKCFERIVKKRRAQVTTVLGGLNITSCPFEWKMTETHTRAVYKSSNQHHFEELYLHKRHTYSFWLRRQGYDNLAKHIFKNLF